MERMANNHITEDRVRKIVQEEISNSLQSITTDIREIKTALLGNRYAPGGLVKKVKSLEGNPVVEWYEDMTQKDERGKSKMGVLDDIISGFTFVRTLLVISASLGLLNAGDMITTILKGLAELLAQR